MILLYIYCNLLYNIIIIFVKVTLIKRPMVSLIKINLNMVSLPKANLAMVYLIKVNLAKFSSTIVSLA